MCDEWVAGWRRSRGRLFQRTGAWWVKDLSVILSRELTGGRCKVTEVDDRVDVLVCMLRRL